MTKVSLTWQERLTVAYAHHVLGHKQQEILTHYPGINPGRISEACKTLEEAAKGASK